MRLPPEETPPLLPELNEEAERENCRRAALAAAAAQGPVCQSVPRAALPLQKRLQVAGDRRQVPAPAAGAQRGGLRSRTRSLEPGGRPEGQLSRDR